MKSKWGDPDRQIGTSYEFPLDVKEIPIPLLGRTPMVSIAKEIDWSKPIQGVTGIGDACVSEFICSVANNKRFLVRFPYRGNASRYRELDKYGRNDLGTLMVCNVKPKPQTIHGYVDVIKMPDGTLKFLNGVYASSVDAGAYPANGAKWVKTIEISYTEEEPNV